MKSKGKIRVGAEISQDCFYGRFPDLLLRLNPTYTEEQILGIEFDCEKFGGNKWVCKAPGFGVLGQTPSQYGNGQVFVHNRADVETQHDLLYWPLD